MRDMRDWGDCVRRIMRRGCHEGCADHLGKGGNHENRPKIMKIVPKIEHHPEITRKSPAQTHPGTTRTRIFRKYTFLQEAHGKHKIQPQTQRNACNEKSPNKTQHAQHTPHVKKYRDKE